MFVTNWISTTKIQKISEITNFFRHYFLSRTEVEYTETHKKRVRHRLMTHPLFLTTADFSQRISLKHLAVSIIYCKTWMV